MKLGVSVVVCTYNGAALLPDTLHYLAQQRTRPEVSWEVIVVDNASNDGTAGVAINEWRKHNSPTDLSVYHQPKQGLTYSRELALKKAQFEFVLFCDDDNWLNSNYVNQAYDTMVQHPQVGVLGGYGELLFETPPPSWALGHGFFANGPQASTSGYVSRKFVYGAGCVIRKSAYEQLLKTGFKPLLTDRAAGVLSSGGDHELCYAIALLGYEIWYEEDLKFKHYMPSTRLNWDYLVRFIKEGSKCFEVVVPYRIYVSLGSRKSLSFHLMLLRIILSYSAKLSISLLHRTVLPPDSEEMKLNTLKIISLHAKIASFKKYRGMERNFKEITRLTQTPRPAPKKKRLVAVAKHLSKSPLFRKLLCCSQPLFISSTYLLFV